MVWASQESNLPGIQLFSSSQPMGVAQEQYSGQGQGAALGQLGGQGTDLSLLAGTRSLGPDYHSQPSSQHTSQPMSLNTSQPMSLNTQSQHMMLTQPQPPSASQAPLEPPARAAIQEVSVPAITFQVCMYVCVHAYIRMCVRVCVCVHEAIGCGCVHDTCVCMCVCNHSSLSMRASVVPLVHPPTGSTSPSCKQNPRPRY